jgi:hypothetical protein
VIPDAWGRPPPAVAEIIGAPAIVASAAALFLNLKQ